MAVTAMIKTFQLTGIRGEEMRDLRAKILSLGGRFVADQHFVPECTHLIVQAAAGLQKMTDKLCSCLAARKWVLTPNYIIQSFERKEWMDETGFERFIRTSSPVIGLPDPTFQKLFSKWTVLLYMSERREKDMMQRILKAGGAQLVADRPLRDEADCLSVIPVTHVVYWGMDPFSAELRQMLQMHIQILSADDIASFVRFQFSVAAGDSDSDSRPASDTSANQLNSSALSCALAIGDGAGADPVVGDRCPAICASQQQDYDMDAEHSEDSLDDDADDKDENWSTCSETECDNRPDDDEAESDKARTTSSSSNGIAASQSTDSDADSSLIETASYDCRSVISTRARPPQLLPIKQEVDQTNTSDSVISKDPSVSKEDTAGSGGDAHQFVCEQSVSSNGTDVQQDMDTSVSSECGTGVTSDEPDNEEPAKRKLSEVDDSEAESVPKKVKIEMDGEGSGSSQRPAPVPVSGLPPDVQPIIEAFCSIRIPETLLMYL